jgi:hypothetical protein
MTRPAINACYNSAIVAFSIFSIQTSRHCEPPGPAFGRPEDKLREAISRRFDRSGEIASSLLSSQ